MKILRLIIVISCWPISSYSQTLTGNQDLMNSLLRKEYRIYHTASRDSFNALIFEKARLLKQANLLEWSYRELCRIETNARISDELSYEKALNSFLRNDFGNSYNQLLSIPDSVRIGTKQYLFLWLLTLSELDKWEECKTIMNRMIKAGKISEEEIVSLQTTVKYKSPGTALKLSSYLPGLGEIYAGNIGKGLTSFIIHAGLIWFAYEQYVAAFYITGTFAGVYPLYRFYNGGRNLSYKLALQYNEAQDWKLRKQYQTIIRKLFE